MQFAGKTYCRAVLLLSAAAATACSPQPRNAIPIEKIGALPPVYDAPDIIGTLGGRKVRMVDYTVQDVMYTDTPLPFDADAWENYKAPKRTYDSQLTSMGFYMNYQKGKLRDLRNDGNFYDEIKVSGTPWVLVGIKNNNEYMNTPEFMNKILERDLEVKPKLPDYNFIKTSEVEYGLQKYIVPGNNPKTGKPWWLENSDSGDLFVAFDKNGNVRSYIKCSNKTTVPNPPCTHRFKMTGGINITLRMGYSRHLLQDWEKIEAAARNIVFGFVKNAEVEESIPQMEIK